MAIIAVAVGFASFGAFGGGHDLFTPESVTHEAEATASVVDRG